MTSLSSGRLLRDLFDAAIDAVSAEKCLPAHLPTPPRGRTVVIGAGKAAAEMARTVEHHWQGPLSGLVITPYRHAVPCETIEVVEAAHPVPDDAGMTGAQRVLESVRGLSADDLVLALMSGGGSALMALPAPGVALADKQAVTRALLRCGATIAEINTVRKHLSAIKGGRLAMAAHPACVFTLVVSDVPGDDPATVASGPTLTDGTTQEQARTILEKFGIDPPPPVAAALADPANETPKPGNVAFAADGVRVVACARDALEATALAARNHGMTATVLGDAIEGEAREVGRHHAAIAIEAARRDPGKPQVLISGGETTVTIRGDGGKGGRNTEYLLALALALEGNGYIAALACDTDGIDGNAEAAGAILLPDSLARARAAGLDPDSMLDRHRSAELFAALGDLVGTGPTRTNVNDFRAILISAGTGAGHIL